MQYSPHPRSQHRLGGFILTLATAAIALVVLSGPASAEINAEAEDTWGVYDRVTSGTNTDTIRSEVMAIEQIGNRLYVGGKFTTVRPTKNGTPTSQPFLAAFDATTGDHLASFQPNLDGPVYALQASPDGSRLFVGGEFGDVAGVANTRALVALDPATGNVDTSWKSQLKLDGRTTVYTLTVDADWLYAGGNFSAVGGAGGVPLTTIYRAVKLDLDTAAPDLQWKPVVTGGSVWGIAVAPDGNDIYLSGYFSNVSFASNSQGFVKVDNTTGTTVDPARLRHNNTNRRFYLDVVTVNDLVFVAGMEHITYVLNESNLSIVTVHSTGGTNNAGFQMGGDYQDLEVVGDRVYAACHCRNEHFADVDIWGWLNGRGGNWSRRDPIKFVAAYSATTGAYIPSFQLDISGSSGIWAIHGAPDGCMWFGGDTTRATRLDGSNQARGGFTKHCDENQIVDTERPGTAGDFSAVATDSHVTLTWSAATDNVGVTGYDVFRSTTANGSYSIIGTATGTIYTDSDLTDGTYWYYLRAFDAAGNQGWRNGQQSATVSPAGPVDTTRPSRATDVVATGINGTTIELTWTAATDDVAVTGYDVYRSTTANGSYSIIGTATSTNYTDTGLAEGTYWYYLRPFDAAGNVGWRNGPVSASLAAGGPVDTTRPSAPRQLVIEGVTATSVDLSWIESTDDVGVAGYVIIDDLTGTVIATSTINSVTVTGLTTGTTYDLYVKADDAAGNRSWRSNIQTVTPA